MSIYNNIIPVLWISVHSEHCSAAIRLLQQFSPISYLLSLLMYHFQLLVMQLLFKGNYNSQYVTFPPGVIRQFNSSQMYALPAGPTEV